MIFSYLKLIIVFGHLLNDAQTQSEPMRSPAATSIDIIVTRSSSTPCGDQMMLNIQDPNTGIVNQYPAPQVGSCLSPHWHVSIPNGLNTNTAYKCWPSRDTDNSQAVATLPNGQAAYNKCGAQVYIDREKF